MSEAILAIVMKLTLVMAGEQEATLLFAGDAMMHQAQIDAAHSLAEGKGYDYSACFEPIEPLIAQADYAVVNLETPIGTGNFTGYPCFNSPVEYVHALSDAGFDLFLTANNHTLDRRDNGLRHTIATLDSLRLPHIGTYSNPAERSRRIPYLANVNGFKIGFLNYTYGTNGFSIQSDAVVDYIDREQISRDIEATRSAGAELLVVAMHWGEEYRLLPVASEKSLADFLVSKGVDMVIGGHPHVVQPYEMRTNPATGKKALVVYSLGNLISNMKTRDTRGGALAVVKLTRDSIGNPTVSDARYELVFTVPPHGNPSKNFVVYPIDSVPAPWQSAADAFRKALK